MTETIKRIGSIKFALLSPEEMRKMSVMKVITADTYDIFDNPIPGGLMDRRMGVIEPGIRCDTCKQKMDECVGHFGHIELAMPIIHAGYVKEIRMFLNATCQNCGRIMLSQNEIEQYRKNKNKMCEFDYDFFEYKLYNKKIVDDARSHTECPHCHQWQVKVRIDKPTTFRTVEVNSQIITTLHIRERLERIPDDDIKLLGYDPQTFRPEWMILRVLPVPPVNVRPTIRQGPIIQEDDLTHKLVDVIKINHKLNEMINQGSPLMIIEDLWSMLQLHINTYFDNQTPGTPTANHKSSSRPLKTLAQRLKGKNGIIRQNLSGKRVNFSARSVISPDPYISINEVGVPIEISRELTVPEMVNSFNIHELTDIILRGVKPVDKNGKYIPGVNYIIKADGRKIRVSDDNKEIVANGLDIKDVVERQLMDGDIVLFNRQPSLHRISIMAHRVRVVEGHTLRLNPSVCPPYNADFDGDEMNLHVLQSTEARGEARFIMMPQDNIISPRYGGPIIGATQDVITGAYLLTHDSDNNGGPYFSKQQTMTFLKNVGYLNIGLMKLLYFPTIIDGKEFRSGKQIFSSLLPWDFSASFRSSTCHKNKCKYFPSCQYEKCENDSYVKIVHGQLICGTIDGSAISNDKGIIISKLNDYYGATITAKFIDNITKISLSVISTYGFSIGIDGWDISDEMKIQITNEKEMAINKAIEIEKMYRSGTLIAEPGRTKKETMEVNTLKNFSKMLDLMGLMILYDMDCSKESKLMCETKSRGSLLNITQTIGCLGQQTVRGERIERGYAHRRLPHFELGKQTHLSKGFVEHSFKEGLSPTEFFFHAMGGREVLVDTAVRTSITGYMQRRLVSAMCDLKIDQLGKVINTEGNIIQFKYGEDGVSPSKTFMGNVIDYNELFNEVFGDDNENSLNADNDCQSGNDYATKEKDLDFGLNEDNIESNDGEDEKIE